MDYPDAPQPQSDPDWSPSGGPAGPAPTVAGRGRRRGAAGGGEPELVELRLHMPRPDVVVVRVSGTMDGVTAPVVARRVGQQLHRAPHVVVDLGDVRVLGPQGLTVLLALHQQAMACGVELHIVGVERAALRRPLHARDLAQLVRFESTVDAVIARLPWQGHVPRQRLPHQS